MKKKAEKNITVATVGLQELKADEGDSFGIPARIASVDIYKGRENSGFVTELLMCDMENGFNNKRLNKVGNPGGSFDTYVQWAWSYVEVKT